MSIRAEWQKLVADGHLFRLEQFIGDPANRTVLMTPEVYEVLTKAMPEGPEANRRSRLLASLQGIVAGQHMVVCMAPFEARKANMGRLDPVEDLVWDVRCQESPAVRAFCLFIEKDVLFAATCRPRSVAMTWLDWLPLGDRHSGEWDRGKVATKRQWGMFFPAHTPVSGDDLNEYLSNATAE
jgi:hypothetical protein